ncbi:hypothetical protein HMPREF0765_3945 [Sphingobacterium spiritivorum ATCC 33300]|uniref:Outer membrane protein beta-barrel domain-containing protein n=1 Tax=Sphingobacterium spiritivorum ATCC 33300 TaxID=525372 RepID=C2G2Y9_SPHSI|nr:hypothetical protein [Sphingobacterium spiritivorum]EEI90358.1 hypothetical protein HMPREF0765_3945 [Sphingobacterium spiritivorum ATCC 33300]QQS95341.1 hypothetical protein I6J03_18475 [Sphingobacterium spiritivorum]
MKGHIIFLLTIIFCAPVASFAQLDCPPVIGGAKKANDKFHITAGAGPTVLYGDLPKSGMSVAFFLKADYRIYKGILVGLEGQIGSLKAAATIDTLNKRKVNNGYYAGFVNVTVFPFQFTDKRLSAYSAPTEILLNSFYLGVGFGGIQSDFKELIEADGTVSNNQGKTTNTFLFPVANAGFAIPVNKYNFNNRTGRYFSVVLNAQFSMGQNDALDGFVPVQSQHNDMYTFYSAGVRYSF